MKSPSHGDSLDRPRQGVKYRKVNRLMTTCFPQVPRSGVGALTTRS